MKKNTQILCVCLVIILITLLCLHIKSESTVIYKQSDIFFKVNKITGKIQVWAGEGTNWKWRTLTR